MKNCSELFLLGCLKLALQFKLTIKLTTLGLVDNYVFVNRTITTFEKLDLLSTTLKEVSCMFCISEFCPQIVGFISLPKVC